MSELNELRKDLEEFLTLQNSKVKKNVEIVSVKDMKFPFMLHIDVDGKTPKIFYPQMPRRAAISEDNTLARVTVADTLLGCIVGYASLDYDFHNVYNKTFNGYEINALEYEYCLKPNQKLVYDAQTTNEHWLVGFNKQHMTFRPFKVGLMFPGEMIYTRQTGPNGNTTPALTKVTMCIHVRKELALSKNKTLKPGEYLVTMDSDQDWTIDRNLTFDEDHLIKIKSINHTEFMKLKKTHAPGLSLEQFSLTDIW